MKATLEFNLEDADDIRAHKRCVQSLDMAIVLWELVHNSKKILEHKIDRAIAEDININPYDSLDLIYDEIHRLLDEHSITPDTLIV